MIIVRLSLAAIFICGINYNAFSTFLDIGNSVSTFAYSLMLSGFCIVFYFYGKWFFFMYKTSLKQTNQSFILENIGLPVVASYAFAFPVAGGNIFSAYYVLSSIGCLVLLFDASGKLSTYLWKIRFHEFASYPDDGVVSTKILNKNRNLVLSILIGLPLAGSIVSKMY